MLHQFHRSQLIGEMVLLLLICLLFIQFHHQALQFIHSWTPPSTYHSLPPVPSPPSPPVPAHPKRSRHPRDGSRTSFTLHSLLWVSKNCVQSDHGLYIYLRDDVRLLMPVFVDDITLACKDGAKIDSIIQELSQHFKLRDLGPTTHILGLEIHRGRPNRQFSISQSQFISNLIQEHGLSNSQTVTTPLNPGTRLSTSMCPQNDAAIPLHLCCRLPDVSCSHHKARHRLCCWSPCQIQLQPWASSLASCQACTSLFEGHHTPQACLPAFHLTRTLHHLFWCWSWW